MMFIRMMSSVIAASALLAAAPALASERGDADARTHPQRCECAAMQAREHHAQTDATEKEKATSDRAEQKNAPRANEVPLGWDPSWGG
jgi:Flp pilus assembly protein TadB